ncbi:hypothetical protein FHG87_011250 [Trinorchestia longiramus]|nr:hypothetical protein FHG87_011250 [Trinorchestia longiramus]
MSRDCCTAALLHCCAAALLHCCTVALLHCCTVALLHCCTTALLHCIDQECSTRGISDVAVGQCRVCPTNCSIDYARLPDDQQPLVAEDAQWNSKEGNERCGAIFSRLCVRRRSSENKAVALVCPASTRSNIKNEFSTHLEKLSFTLRQKANAFQKQGAATRCDRLAAQRCRPHEDAPSASANTTLS